MRATVSRAAASSPKQIGLKLRSAHAKLLPVLDIFVSGVLEFYGEQDVCSRATPRNMRGKKESEDHWSGGPRPLQHHLAPQGVVRPMADGRLFRNRQPSA